MFKLFKIGVCATLLTLGLTACSETIVPNPPPVMVLSSLQSVAFNKAIAHFEQMVMERPGEIEAVLGLARNLRWAGRSAEAAQTLKAHQAQFVMDGRYLSELGKVKLVLGKNTEGVKFLEQATHKVTDDWRLYSALGIGLDDQKNYDQAEVAYRKALDMCPDDPAVINNLGISQGLSGRVDQAIITLQRALSYGRHSDKIKRNLDLFIDARDLCDKCGATYLKGGNAMILAAGLMDTDKEGPCTPIPKYTAKAPVMVQKLAPKAAIPSINIKVYFEFDSDILKPEALDVLNNLGKALTYGDLNNYRFQIAGHTDAVGPKSYNQSLSERRAQSVVQYLKINFNIDPARIDAVGYGESQLLDPSMPDGDVNRRVQVTRLSKLSNTSVNLEFPRNELNTR